MSRALGLKWKTSDQLASSCGGYYVKARLAFGCSGSAFLTTKARLAFDCSDKLLTTKARLAFGYPDNKSYARWLGCSDNGSQAQIRLL